MVLIKDGPKNETVELKNEVKQNVVNIPDIKYTSQVEEKIENKQKIVLVEKSVPKTSFVSQNIQNNTQISQNGLRVNTNITTRIPNVLGMTTFSIPNKIFFKGTLSGNPFKKFKRRVLFQYLGVAAFAFIWLARPSQEFIEKVLKGK
jgi:hypothetical protein